MTRPFAIAIVLLFSFLINSVQAKVPVDGATKLRVENSLAKLPLRFEKNEGQTSDEVKFLSRGNGYTLYFTPTEAVTVLSRAIDGPSMEDRLLYPMKAMQPTKTETSIVRMEVVGADKNAVIKGEDKLPGTSNYFKGNDQSKWRQGVENFQKVHYEEVYPGIDLVYYGNQKKLEYDFVVKPGADPEKIELNFKGTESFFIDDHGNLILETKTGKVVQHAPIIYQTIEGKKKSIEGSYVIQNNHNVAFKLAQYNPDHNLVIDPVLGFSTYLGGNDRDSPADIVVDELNNIYITGSTHSTDFDLVNEIEGSSASVDIFISKLEQKGNVPSLAFSTYLGGSGVEFGGGIAIDDLKNIYVTGYTDSPDFDTLNEIEGATRYADVFVVKLEQANNIPTLAFSTYLGGSFNDYGQSIEVDSSGSIYVSGNTHSGDFDTLNAIEGDSAGIDIFVFKLEQSGNIPSLAFSTYLGGSVHESGNDIALDSSGNIYVTGRTNSPDFDVLNEIEGPNQVSLEKGDVFVVKIEQNNNIPSLAFSTYLGGTDEDISTGIEVRGSNKIYVTGYTKSTDFEMVNAIEGDSGELDIFVFKLEETNNVPTLAFSTYLGGSKVDYAFGIDLDKKENIYITGYTNSPDYDILNEIESYQGSNLWDLIVTKLEQNNNIPSISYSTYLVGRAQDFGIGISVSDSGNAYVFGQTGSNDFDTLNPIEGSSLSWDLIISKFIINTAPPIITAPADTNAEATGQYSFPDINTATATDDATAPDDIIITNDAPEGGFLLGLTVVTWTAEDEEGNTATATQNVTIVDTTPPLITLLGANPINAEIGLPYIDPWVTVLDLVDGPLAATPTSTVTSIPGVFLILFHATDSSGNTGENFRFVISVDTTPPVITINGANPATAIVGQPYVDLGATAVDLAEGPVPVTLTTQLGAAPGTFEVVYSVTDSTGNTTTATRVVNVVP